MTNNLKPILEKETFQTSQSIFEKAYYHPGTAIVYSERDLYVVTTEQSIGPW